MRRFFDSLRLFPMVCIVHVLLCTFLFLFHVARPDSQKVFAGWFDFYTDYCNSSVNSPLPPLSLLPFPTSYTFTFVAVDASTLLTVCSGMQ